MGPHCNLPLKPLVADRTMEGQLLIMSRHVLGQVVFPEEPLLTNPALKRLHPGMPHPVSPHVCSVRELHVADVALKRLFWVVLRIVGLLVSSSLVSLEQGVAAGVKVALVTPE